MERALIFFLAALISCAHSPEPRSFATGNSVENQECLKHIEEADVKKDRSVLRVLAQTTGTTGSYFFTSFGVITDTVLVSTGVAGSVWLCSMGNRLDGCGQILGSYMGLMEDLNLVWMTKKIHRGTATWRCPPVDHISRAVRRASTCLHEKGEFIAAFEQIDHLKTDELITECSSEEELEKVKETEARLKGLGN